MFVLLRLFELITLWTEPVWLLLLFAEHAYQRQTAYRAKLDDRLHPQVRIEDWFQSGRMYTRILLTDPEVLLGLRGILAYKRFTMAYRTFPIGNLLAFSCFDCQ